MYKIIIVEDDRGIAEGISSCLADWGMETRQITDFRRVMEEIEEYEPHLVILDITLPYMGGYYWCQEIRRTSAVPRTCVGVTGRILTTDDPQAGEIRFLVGTKSID